MNIFNVIWNSIKTFYNELFFLIGLGILVIISIVFILPGPFAVAGLWLVAQHAVESKSNSWQTFWEGVKTYGLRNWANTALVLFGYALLAGNLWFYNNPDTSPLPNNMVIWLNAIWIIIGILWTSIAFYLLTFQIMMEEPKLLLSLRNSLYFTLLHPIQTTIYLTSLVGLFRLCMLIPPLFILVPGFTAVLSLTAVKTLIQPIVNPTQETE